MANTHGLSRRSFFGAAVAGAASVPLLASCAKGSGGAGSTGFKQVSVSVPAKYRNRKHKVVIWSAWDGANGKALDGLLQKFNESQDDIFASAQFQGAYAVSAPKLSAALQAKATPDIAVLADTYWGRYLLNDVLEPFDSYFTRDWDKSVFVDELVNEGVAKDKLYWVSFARSTPLFYYNRELFHKIGLPDRGPKTWDELRSWGPEVLKVKANGRPVRLHAFGGADDWEFLAAAWEFGGSFSDGLDVTIDKGGSVEAAEWQRKLIFEDKFAYLATDFTVDFENGLIATCMGSTGSLRAMYDASKFEVGASPLPTETATGIPTGGAGFVLLRGVPKERKEAAVEVIKFLSSPASSAEWSLQTGYMPVIKAAVNEPALAASIKKDPNVSVAVKQLPHARKTDAIRAFAPNGTEDIITGLQKIYSSNQHAEPVFSAVAAKLRKGVETIQKHYDTFYA